MEYVEPGEPGQRFDLSQHDLVSIDGLGPCTGVFIYEPTARVAYGVHLSSPHMHQSNLLIDTLEDAAQEFGSPIVSVKVFVSGSCDDGQPGTGDEPSAVRAFVEAEVRKILPTASHQFDWAKTGVAVCNMELNLTTGEIRYD